MIQVEKRDGTLVKLNIQKISSAIERAFRSIRFEVDSSIIDFLTLKVTADFQPKIKNGIVNVESIQDSVEKVLSQAGYSEVSKSYILYRKQRESVRELRKSTEEYISIIDSYIEDDKWRQSENSMDNYSVGGMIFSNSGAVTSNYWIYRIYDDEISKAHNSGEMHIHDLDMLTGDSAGWSIDQIIKEGLVSVNRNVHAKPAKHLHTICNQIMNFLSIVQNEWAGAQSLMSFDSYLAPFVKKDQLSYKEVYQCLENFIYGINMPNRWGSNVPFSNIVLNWTVPNELKEKYVVIQGEVQDFQYKDCQNEMNIINQAIMEILLKDNSNERGFKFPIPTIQISEDFEYNKGLHTEYLFEFASKYGIPHFENRRVTKSRISKSKDFTFTPNHLCMKAGGYFGYGENMGSIGAVTINIPRVAYTNETEEEFFNGLERILNLAARSLHVKRQVLNRFLERGLYPYTKQYLKSFDHHFSTIGIIGMHEAIDACQWLKGDYKSDEGIQFSKKVMEFIKDKLISYQIEYNEPFNLEATPAEGVTYRFAKLDRDYLNGKLYYTNSTQLKVDTTSDIFEALDHQEVFQNEYTGGTLFNVYLQSKLSSPKNAKNLIKTIFDNYSIPYLTISPTYSYCEEHGYIPGHEDVCPHCMKKAEVYSNVTGYYRCLEEWNEGKKQEYLDRVYFEVE